jgi:hypothetical protein
MRTRWLASLLWTIAAMQTAAGQLLNVFSEDEHSVIYQVEVPAKEFRVRAE